MANVGYMSGQWIAPGSGGSSDLQPGQTHYWTAWNFVNQEAVSVTAHPIADRPPVRVAPPAILAVENVQMSVVETPGQPDSHTLLFTIRNAGTVPIIAYGVGISFVSQ